MVEAVAPRDASPRVALPQAWPLILGAVALGVPTLGALGRQVWTQEWGAHGPILLAASAWLIWRQKDDLARDAVPGNPVLVALATLVFLATYVFGKAYDFLTLESLGLYGVVMAFFYSCLGAKSLLRNWFPFFYLALLVPPPLWALDYVTSPLKEFVSHVATEVLSAAGLPVSRHGVALFIAQYQLLVEDACSGMNSIVGLISVSLLYIYLMHGARLVYSLILLAVAVPIAIAANILRIMVLLLLTYFGGDELAQGFAHFTAGMFLFAVALGMVFLCDKLLSRLLPKSVIG